MKKAIVISLYVCLSTLTAAAQQSELIIIGDVHQAASNYNADTLLRIFEKLQPDIILLEVDSAHFTSDSTFANPSAENEQTATTRFRTQRQVPLSTKAGTNTGFAPVSNSPTSRPRSCSTAFMRPGNSPKHRQAW